MYYGFFCIQIIPNLLEKVISPSLFYYRINRGNSLYEKSEPAISVIAVYCQAFIEWRVIQRAAPHNSIEVVLFFYMTKPCMTTNWALWNCFWIIIIRSLLNPRLDWSAWLYWRILSSRRIMPSPYLISLFRCSLL